MIAEAPDITLEEMSGRLNLEHGFCAPVSTINDWRCARAIQTAKIICFPAGSTKKNYGKVVKTKLRQHLENTL